MTDIQIQFDNSELIEVKYIFIWPKLQKYLHKFIANYK
jgi:hypothetical protein